MTCLYHLYLDMQYLDEYYLLFCYSCIMEEIVSKLVLIYNVSFLIWTAILQLTALGIKGYLVILSAKFFTTACCHMLSFQDDICVWIILWVIAHLSGMMHWDSFIQVCDLLMGEIMTVCLFSNRLWREHDLKEGGKKGYKTIKRRGSEWFIMASSMRKKLHLLESIEAGNNVHLSISHLHIHYLLGPSQ